MISFKGRFRLPILGLALVSGLVTLAPPGRAPAQDQDAGASISDDLLAALKNPAGDQIELSVFALNRAAELKGQRVARADATTQLTADLTEFMGEIEDIEPNARGQIVLDEKLGKIRDILVTFAITKTFGKVGEVPPPPPRQDREKPAAPKASDRLKKQELNIILLALQEYSDLQKDRKLTASELRGEFLKNVLQIAAEVADFPDSDPKEATQDEVNYLTNLCDEIIAGRVARPTTGPRIGLAADDQSRLRDTLMVRGAELARRFKPGSAEFNTQLRTIAEQEFRKLAKLGSADPLSDPQSAFINSLVRQVASQVDISLTGVSPTGTTGALDSVLRGLIVGLAKSLNRALVGAAMSNPSAQGYLNAETRRAALLNFVLGMIVKKRGLSGLEALSEAERADANTIVQEALSDASVNVTGTNPGVVPVQPVVTVPVMTQTTAPVMFLYVPKRHFLCFP